MNTVLNDSDIPDIAFWQSGLIGFLTDSVERSRDILLLENSSQDFRKGRFSIVTKLELADFSSIA